MSGEDEKRFNEPLCAGKRSFDAVGVNCSLPDADNGDRG